MQRATRPPLDESTKSRELEIPCIYQDEKNREVERKQRKGARTERGTKLIEFLIRWQCVAIRPSTAALGLGAKRLPARSTWRLWAATGLSRRGGATSIERSCRSFPSGRDCAPLRPSRPRRETTRQRRPTARLAVGGLPSRLLAARSLENALKRTRRRQFSLASSTRQLREKLPIWNRSREMRNLISLALLQFSPCTCVYSHIRSCKLRVQESSDLVCSLV